MNKATKELNRINNKLDNQVNTENNDALTDIICYLCVANISEYDQEVVRHDLLEMILSAQNRGENIQAVIGKDYKVFCDDIIENLPQKTIKGKIIDFFDSICWCLSIIIAIGIITTNETISLISNLIKGESLSFDITITQGSIISYAIIIVAASILVEVIMRKSFQIGTVHISTAKAFFLGAGIMVIFLFIAWVGRSTLFTVNIFVACIVSLMLYIIHRILARI